MAPVLAGEARWLPNPARLRFESIGVVIDHELKADRTVGHKSPAI
jgi:hypothetical protein